jgi:hypothetical protein
MIRIRHITCVLLLFAAPGLSAQSLQGITENQIIKKYLVNHPAKLKSAAKAPLLTLPFFDDFSGSDIFPDPLKWSDRYAFINNSFAEEPISIGVATMDAIDENGDVYALTDWPASSDMLTSLGFDLSSYSPPGDLVRLSFFYQAGGKGEVPEMMDSLLLEFYSPAEKQWNKVWDATLDTATPFQQVILDVPGSYYQSGFQFRFRNYTSLSADEVAGREGALSNVDCWNIDYVMMNTMPVSAHQEINDIALVEPPRYLLDFYESIPWLHLNEAQNITLNFLQYVFRNLEKKGIDNLGRNYYAKDLGTGDTEFGEEFYDDFVKEEIIRRNDPFMVPFTRKGDSDEGNIEVGGYLITPEGQFKQNDTATTIVHFKDYYAYDDGSPEYGFGISGPSMAGALLGYRFRIYKPDTLRAMDIYFNKVRNNYTANLGFHLCVWKDDGAKPGDLIYMSQEEFTPQFGSGMTEFRRYPISPDTNLIVTDTSIYIGWKQVSEEFLNLGYDVNRDNIDRIFVNTSGEWYNPGSSIVPGSLMIRAVFGSKDVITGVADIPASPLEVTLFPNPVSDKLNIRASGFTVDRVSVFDVYGRLVLHAQSSPGFIDVSGLPSGIYQVTIISDQERCVTRKIIVCH